MSSPLLRFFSHISPPFLALLVVWIAGLVWYWPTWTTPTDMAEYAAKYSGSQYVLGNGSEQWVSDSELYVYAGHAYMLGQDPTTINFEHPPLGKYVYGLSYVLTGNVYLVNLVLFPVLLYLVARLIGIVTKNKWLQAGGVTVFGLQPLVFTLLPSVLLDYLFVASILGLFVVLPASFRKHWQKYVLVGTCLGFTAAVKYPIPFIFIPFAVAGLVAVRERKILYMTISSLVAGLIYLASYTLYFLKGHTLLDLLAFEKYRFVWWTGERTAPKWLIFENLFTGQHPAWWAEGMQVTAEWTIILPLIFCIAVLSIFFIRRTFWSLLLAAFGIGMMVVYGFAASNSLRYVILLIPFWLAVITDALTVTKVSKLFSRQRKNSITSYRA